MECKKGFTIIELVCVIGLIVMLIGIFTLSAVRFQKSRQEEDKKDLINQMIAAADTYVSNNRESIKKLYEGYGYVDIPVGDLREAGLIKEKLIDPTTGEEIRDDEIVRVTLGLNDELNFQFPVEDNIQAWMLVAEPLTINYDTSGKDWCQSPEVFNGLIESPQNNTDYIEYSSKLYLMDNTKEGLMYTGDYFDANGVNLRVSECNVDTKKQGLYNITYRFRDPDLKIEKMQNRVVYVDKKAFKVNFDTNGGNPSFIKPIEQRQGSFYQLPEEPIKEGFNFKGWYTDLINGTLVNNNTIVEQNGEHTLYAHWEEKSYNVTFNCGSCYLEFCPTNCPSSRTVKYSDNPLGYIEIPKKKGYTFGGWIDNTGKTYSDLNSYYVYSHTQFIAKWTIKTVTVSFNTHVSGLIFPTKTIIFGSSYEELPNPIREGYQFEGWYTASTGGTEITSQSKMLEETNHTLHAHWKAKGDSEETLADIPPVASKVEETKTPHFEIPSPPNDVMMPSKYNNINIISNSSLPFKYDNATGIFTSTAQKQGEKSFITISPNTTINNASVCYEVLCHQASDKAFIYVNGSLRATDSGANSKCVNIGSIDSSTKISVEFYKGHFEPIGKNQVSFFLSDDVSIVSKYNDETGIWKMEDDYGTSYFYRGNIIDNYVLFGSWSLLSKNTSRQGKPMYWRIVRINGDGSLRLAYDGTYPHENGDSSSDRIAIFNAFYPNTDDIKVVGYMFSPSGNGASTSLREAQTNTYNSDLKRVVDEWYEENFKGTKYEQYLSDTIFCNDRQVVSGSGYGKTTSIYAPSTRIGFNATIPKPTFKCVNKNDRFTVENDIGNQALTYPVGVLSADEIMAGGAIYFKTDNSSVNTKFYLYKGNTYLTMTPYSYEGGAYLFSGFESGCLRSRHVHRSTSFSNSNIVPVINLSKEYVSSLIGNGTMNNPYRLP